MDIEDNYFFENIKNNELICRQFKDFNDPYEAHFGINANWPSLYKEEKKLKDLIRRLEPERYSDITNSKDAIKKYIQSHSQLRDDALDIISNLLMNFRVCSFTRRWNHILMWSHYANGCRGVVLIFDENKILDCKHSHLIDSNEALNGTNVPLRWVSYNSSPRVLNSVEILESGRLGTQDSIDSISKKIIDVCVLSKYRAWRYEQESRMIVGIKENIGKNPILYQYSPEALKGVIIGHKCDIKKIKELSSLLTEDTMMYLTKPDNNRYKVKIFQAWRAVQIANDEVGIKSVVENSG